MLEQHRRHLLARDLGDARVDVVDAVELRQQPGCRLRADARHSGEVVRAIAAQRGELHVAVRWDAEALLDGGGRHLPDVADALERVKDSDVAVDELHRVPVARHDGDTVPVGDGLRRERREHVVGLDARDLDDRDAQDVEHLVEPVDLGPELVGHLVAAGLVVRVGGRALLVLADVEGDGDRSRLALDEQPHEHRDEAVDRVGELARRGAERVGEREVRAVGQAVTIEQEQQRTRVAIGSWHGGVLVPGVWRLVTSWARPEPVLGSDGVQIRWRGVERTRMTREDSGARALRRHRGS